MATPNACRLELIWEQGTVPWAMNVFHLNVGVQAVDQVFAEFVGSEVENAITGTHAPATGPYEGFLAATTGITRVRLKDLRVDGADYLEAPCLASGTGAGGQIPDNVSLAMRLKTASGEPNGRTFLWGWANDNANNTDGRPTNGAAVRAEGFLNSMWQSLNLAVLSRRDNAVYDVIGADRSLSSGLLGWNTQTRRRDGLVGV